MTIGRFLSPSANVLSYRNVGLGHPGNVIIGLHFVDAANGKTCYRNYFSATSNYQHQQETTIMREGAIIVVDIQNGYFPGGKYELNGMTRAAANAARVFEAARKA